MNRIKAPRPRGSRRASPIAVVVAGLCLATAGCGGSTAAEFIAFLAEMSALLSVDRIPTPGLTVELTHGFDDFVAVADQNGRFTMPLNVPTPANLNLVIRGAGKAICPHGAVNGVRSTTLLAELDCRSGNGSGLMTFTPLLNGTCGATDATPVTKQLDLWVQDTDAELRSDDGFFMYGYFGDVRLELMSVAFTDENGITASEEMTLTGEIGFELSGDRLTTGPLTFSGKTRTVLADAAGNTCWEEAGVKFTLP